MCGVTLREGSHLLQLSASREVFEQYLLPAEAEGFVMADLCVLCLDRVREEQGHPVPADYEQFARIERMLRHGAFLNACVTKLLRPTERALGLWQVSTLVIEPGDFATWAGGAHVPQHRLVAEIAHPPNLTDAVHRTAFVMTRLFERPAGS